jgi:hypothetical protein
MTTTRQHIEDLDVDKWAALTRRAAADSVAAAERVGLQPRAESVALAGMSERELAQHRQRNGPPVPRRSLAMQLVEADHQRRVAEEQAREAHQGRLDAEAKAALARAEADESARAATAAGERVRAVEAEAARKDAERRAQRAADQKAMQQLQAEIERVRAGAAAEVAAAEEKVRAAEARAVERTTERATERATGEEAVARVRGELEKVRSDAAAEVAAARGQASGDVAAAREAAEAEIAAAREAAEAEVARWQAHAGDMERWARAEVSTQLLTIPVPPMEVRTRIGSAETTIDALYQIDYVLEVGLAEDEQTHFEPDLEFTRNLIWKVQEQAKGLTRELADHSASGYAEAATDAYRALLQRIDAAVQALGGRFHSPDADIIAMVTAMLADLRTQGLY